MIDIGTGDGRFVSAAAAANPNKFFIGIDANVKPLEKPSMKATRKPSKGGLHNAIFIQASVEELPEELDGVADEIHIHFPWASLLKAVAAGDADVLRALRRIAGVGCLLELVIGIDPVRDAGEIARLGMPGLAPKRLAAELIRRCAAAGFEPIETRELARSEWSQLETTWAKKLQGGSDRTVLYFLFRAKESVA